MAEYKPAIIKRIYFQKLTFGSTPAQYVNGDEGARFFAHG